MSSTAELGSRSRTGRPCSTTSPTGCWRLLELLPRLEVVLLLGRHAQRSWSLLTQTHPNAAARLAVLQSRHPSRQAFIGNAAQREQWQEEQTLVFEQAREALRGTCTLR